MMKRGKYPLNKNWLFENICLININLSCFQEKVCLGMHGKHLSSGVLNNNNFLISKDAELVNEVW